jgi:4-hydroxy-tetrahydrodipicolinate synthase
MSINWRGVIPAVTTPFNHDDSIDHGFYHQHIQWMQSAGCIGVVPSGSLGEGATLTIAEKISLYKTAVSALNGHGAVIPGIAALSTAEAVYMAQAAADAGCKGLMVLPPYVYATDWREMKAHITAVISATDIPVMLYNNPPAYKTDFTPSQVAELANEYPTLVAIKESSADVRRIHAIQALIDNRLELLMGVDDLIVEGINVGVTGWIAGLVNSFPHESVALFDQALAVANGHGDKAKLAALYHWFLPLLRLDVVTKFVQLIKLSQEMVNMGSSRVRAPRLVLSGNELAEAQAIIAHAIATRPTL